MAEIRERYDPVPGEGAPHHEVDDLERGATSDPELPAADDLAGASTLLADDSIAYPESPDARGAHTLT